VTQTGTVVHLALYYSTIHGADGVYKAARPKTAAATPPRAYFGAPVGIAPESDSDSDEEELLSAPAAPPLPPDMEEVIEEVMLWVLVLTEPSESVLITTGTLELRTLVESA